MNRNNILIIGLVLVVFLVLLFVYTTPEEVKEVEKIEIIKTDNNMNLDPSTHKLEEGKKYLAVIKTNKGDMKVELFADKTPNTVNNFVYLAKEKFYDGIVFHRIIKDFMIQAGCPKGDGTGDAGYKFDDEKFEGEYTRGTLAMANAGPNTNGSQFFIMHKDNQLPPNYIIFGNIVEGLDTLDKIAEVEVSASMMGEMSVPVEPVMINTIEIIEE